MQKCKVEDDFVLLDNVSVVHEYMSNRQSVMQRPLLLTIIH